MRRHRPLLRASPFVGRGYEIDCIARAFAAGARLVTLLGPGGVGKTRLAERYAELHTERVVICALADAFSVQDLTLCVLSSLGGDDDHSTGGRSPSADVDRAASALSHLGATLIVLDNFEQLVDDGARVVAHWVDAAPNAAFLVTSRRALDLGCEHRVPIGPLERKACLELFDSTAARLAVGSPVSADRSVVHRIVDALDRLPLAIELAAARLLVLAPEEMLLRLSDRFALLRTSRPDVEPRHATLAATLAWSCDLLTEAQRSALGQCTVFHGGFDLAGAEAVIRATDGSSALDVVQELLDRSLLHLARADPGRRRFDMLDTIRAFADSELRTSDDLTAAEQRHATHYATRFHGLIEPSHDALAVERANLAAVVARAARDQPSLAAQAALSLEPFLRTRVSRQEHRRWLDDTLETATRARESDLCARARLRRARARSIEGELADAELDLEQARAGLDAESGAVWIERARTEAMIRRLQRRLPEAIALSEEALRAVRAMPDHVVSEGHVLRELAVVLMLAGKRDAAEERYRQSLAAHRLGGDRQAEATLLCDLGVLLLDAGNVDEADGLLAEALAIHQERGDRWREAIALSNVGVLEHQRGRIEASRATWERGLAVHRELGNARFEAFSLGGLGALDIEQGRLEAARTSLARAAEIFASLGDARWGGWAVARLATAHAAGGELDRARAAFMDARALLAHADPSWWQTTVETLEGSLDLRRFVGAPPSADATSGERIARRLVDALVARAGAAAAEPAASREPSVMGTSDALRLGPDALWFEAPGGSRVDMSRRRVGRRLLLRLVERRIEAPGTVLTAGELVAEGWPGERMRRQSASSRLYVAVRELRQLGLHDVLVTTRGGYMLHASIAIERETLPARVEP